ncbi:MAG: DMT family transporter [Marinisporobacter sp.]|nr:DMT family transporter [Marinisporobacter sp.]
MRKNFLYFLLILTVIFWGTSFGAVKIGIGNLSPVQFLFLRTLFATIIFSIILFKTPKNKRKVSKKDIPYIMYLGFMGIGGYFIVQYTALEYTTTVNASLLVGLAPIIVAIYSCLFLKEKLELVRIMGIAMCFAGIILIITKGNVSNLSFGKTMFGDMLMLLNAVMLAIFSIGAKKILKKYDPFIVVAYMNIFALIMLAPFAFTSNFLSSDSLLSKFNDIDMKAILAALYLGATCTVLGYYSWYSAIKEFGPSRTSVFNYINPLVASIVSFMLFDEGINVCTILGGISIIGGVALNNVQNILHKKEKFKQKVVR